MTTSVVAEAAAAARRSELIVIPTDTVYGLATRPDDPQATARLFTAKRRPVGMSLPVLAATAGEAQALGAFDERAQRLATECWPGPLTLVVPRSERTHTWSLGSEEATIAIRVPAHRLALAVLADAGPLAATSANRSGDPPAQTCDELVEAFGDLVAVYLCQEEPLEGSASTVVDLAHGAPRILRAGGMDPDELRQLWGG